MAQKAERRPTRSEARAARRDRQKGRRQFRKRILLGTASVLGAVIIISFLLPQGIPIFGSRSSPGASTGPGERVTIVSGPGGRTVGLHVSLGQPHSAYNTVPATSGSHHPSAIPWGIYADPRPDEDLVHNLEHGGIGIHYDCPEGCEDLVPQLADIADRYRLGIILSPYSGMDTRIALTAWGWIDRFDEFDEQRILDFINGHMDRGPEPLH